MCWFLKLLRLKTVVGHYLILMGLKLGHLNLYPSTCERKLLNNLRAMVRSRSISVNQVRERKKTPTQRPTDTFSHRVTSSLTNIYSIRKEEITSTTQNQKYKKILDSRQIIRVHTSLGRCGHLRQKQRNMINHLTLTWWLDPKRRNE